MPTLLPRQRTAGGVQARAVPWEVPFVLSPREAMSWVPGCGRFGYLTIIYPPAGGFMEQRDWDSPINRSILFNVMHEASL